MSSTPKRIVFLDFTCPTPYDAKDLETRPLGGTEASVIRVSEGLAKRGLDVIVAQHNRKVVGEGAATYLPLDTLDQIGKTPHVVIGLRIPHTIQVARERFGLGPKLFLWCHDFNAQQLVEEFPKLHGTGVKILGVSRTHKTLIADALLRQVPDLGGVTASFIYNPVDLEPDETSVLHRKLVFFSSPHKGLRRTLELFAKLREKVDYELYIGNPGYVEGEDKPQPGVIYLGSLPHAEIIKHVRSALCVLHLNDEFDETFGLVHAEANAVGTPVLTSMRGANHEVLGFRNGQTIDVRDDDEVIRRILLWSEQRPQVSGNPDFKLSNVLNAWEGVLNG